jgi:putative ABC transport system substrate-binding protein
MRLWNNIFTGLLALLCLLSLGNGAASADDRIAVLMSMDEAPFRQTLAGFQAYLSTQGVQAGYDVYNLKGDAAYADPALLKIKQSGVKLIFALGSLATEAAIREAGDIPIIAGLVLRTDGLGKAPNATGVGLEFSVETQFAWLQRLLPEVKTVGVIYNPGENRKRVEAAARAAKERGLRLEAEEVEVPQDVPAALNNLSKSADVLWGVADSLALSPQIAKNIILFSFRNSIPLIGPSQTWVKAGALYALDWDYADIGAQCGEMARRVLQGAPPSSIAPEPPRTVLYSLNLSAARQLKIDFPDELVRGARQTY